ncbi:MAG: N-formylglutamate amidohydrolase [Burkholderiales bacterium]
MTRLLVTCEHGGNRIPAQYRALFKKYRPALESPRGYDLGALALARAFAGAFDAELVYSTTSRLLVELNRSPNHRQFLSEATRELPTAERERLLGRYYWPYRHWVEAQVTDAIKHGERVLHVSSHSFTPRLNGVVRNADIGLLYDPRRAREREFCRVWKARMEGANPQLVVRLNYPYRGSADGLTTHLRRLHRNSDYAGIEIEVNQKHALGDTAAWTTLRKLLVGTLQQALTAAEDLRVGRDRSGESPRHSVD